MKRITSFLLAIVLLAGLVLTAAPAVYAASEMKVSDALVNTGRAMLGGGNSQASAGNAQQTNLY